MNAVLVKGDAVGPTLFYRRGAGAEATASAVVADLVDVTRMHTADPEQRVPHLAFQPDRMRDVFGADILYFHPTTGEVGLCQTTTRANQSSRIAKAKGLVAVQGWVNHHKFVVHGWKLTGPRGAKRKTWEVQVTELGTEDEKKLTAEEAPLFVQPEDF
jgi:hypothetical protein